MKVRPGSRVWELQDDEPYSLKNVSSDDYYFKVAGRSDETLAIMEADLAKGAGWTASRNDVTFRFESVVQIGTDGRRLRILGSTHPTFGDWKDVTDEVSD